MRSYIVESYTSFGNLKICLLSYWYVYQCLFLTLFSLLATFILCNCTCIMCYSFGLSCNLVKYCKCKLPLVSFVGIDFAIKSILLEESMIVSCIQESHQTIIDYYFGH